MNKLASISLWSLALLASVCLSACSSDDDVDASLCPEEGEFYLTLHLSYAVDKAGTRAGTPAGGEDGDGRENGFTKENKIHNVCFFIYNDEGKNFNAANPTTTFKYKKYLDDSELLEVSYGYDSKPIRIERYIPEEGDRIILLANLGSAINKYNTIEDLRNAQVSKTEAWYPSSQFANYDYFVMTSATDTDPYGKVVISTHAGSYGDPFEATIEVERIAARVDFILPSSLSASNQPQYTVVQAGTEGTMVVTDIRLVNESQKPTYLIRRLASQVNPLSPTVNYMEKVVTAGGGSNHPTKYVVEPLSTQKNATLLASIADATLADWYGTSAFQFATSTSFITGTEYSTSTKYYPQKFTVDAKSVYTLGYVMENVPDKSGQDKRLMTGMQLKCQFTPTTVYECTSLGGALNPFSYTAGNDFWYMEDKTDRTQSKFFNTEASLDNYANGRTDIIKHHYAGGVCYYYIWLRHAMYDELAQSGTFPMEYAIVRNNIYRTEIEQVLSIGADTPDPTPHELIKVRKWYLRELEEIRL